MKSPLRIMTIVMVVVMSVSIVFILNLWNQTSFHPYCDGTSAGYTYRPYHPYAMYLLVIWIFIFIHLLFVGIRSFTNTENKSSW